MKNTTKALLIIVLFILTIGSCRKSDIVPVTKPIDLGLKSTNMTFNSLPKQVDSYVLFDVKVTPGSKYSIQVTDLKGDAIASQGLAADEEVESIKLDISKVSKGIYDLIFIDTKGNEIKQPLIIK